MLGARTGFILTWWISHQLKGEISITDRKPAANSYAGCDATREVAPKVRKVVAAM